MKTIHGHFSDKLKEEAERIKKLYKEKLDIEISWNEATAIAGIRSQNIFMTNSQLKEILSKLRGL